MIVKIIVIALYALMIVIIGIMGLKKTKSFNDYFLGGGNVGAWMSAFSYGTAYFSAVLFIGFAGKVGWGFGYSGLWIAFFNALIGVGLVWAVMGWRIKKMSTEYGVSTMSEFLEKRYNSSFLKLAAVVVIFIFLIPYTAAVFMGLSYLFELNFNIEYWQALVFMGVFTAVYIVLGGYKSMAMIDMIFGIIMVVSVLLLFGFTLNKGGGLMNITEKLSAIQPKLTQLVGPAGFGNLFALVFLTSVAPFAMPQLVQKFYAIRDRKAVKRGMIFSTIFALIIGGVAYFLGSTTRVFFSPEVAPTLFNNGKPIFDKLMPELLTSVIPASLVVIVLLLILSASMSTLASLVLISSSSISKDLYAGFINKNASDKKLTGLMRIMSAVFILLAVLLALVQFDVIVEILGISWGAIGSFFLGPFVWGLFCKKVNKLGAISSGIIGLGVCLALYFIGLGMKGQIVPWYFTAPGAGTIGMITSLVINPLFSSFCCKGSCRN
ncbi:MAG: sodium:solute symporter family protein [Bacteroidales bacterium]|nr:sodium:solute symporter family protein [Bacteroidales bacterium]